MFVLHCWKFITSDHHGGKLKQTISFLEILDAGHFLNPGVKPGVSACHNRVDRPQGGLSPVNVRITDFGTASLLDGQI